MEIISWVHKLDPHEQKTWIRPGLLILNVVYNYMYLLLITYRWRLHDLQMTHYVTLASHCHLFLSSRFVSRHPLFVLWIVLNNSECNRIFPNLSI